MIVPGASSEICTCVRVVSIEITVIEVCSRYVQRVEMDIA